MAEPRGEFLRRGDVQTWLEDDYGIPRQETRKLMECGTIEGKPLRPEGYNFYRKSQILGILQGNGGPQISPISADLRKKTNQEGRKVGKGN